MPISDSMDYERIHKPLPYKGGGFSVSPKKLRSMLLGLEKSLKEEGGEQPISTDQEIQYSDNRNTRAMDCQDMECSTSVSISKSGPQQQTKTGLTHDNDNFDSDRFSFGFEFQKQDTVPTYNAPVPVQRFTLAHSFPSPFSKPAPSKWDDAEKWISSPSSNMNGNGKMNRNNGMMVNKVVVVNPKKVYLSKVQKVGVITGSGFGLGKAKGKGLSWVDEPFSLMDLSVNDDGFGAAKPVVNSSVSINQSNLPAKDHLKAANGISEVRSVSMRDMGTEMTPIASEDPSRTTTPIRANTPDRYSTSSRAPTLSRNDATLAASELESQGKTRRDIMELSEQLGKTNIAAWATQATREDENRKPEHLSKIELETHAADWEEAEKSKYLDRFQRDEASIQAWENHQKSKIEAEMQKIEANLEKIRAHAQEKLMIKLAAAKHKADEKRAVADAKLQKEATRTAKQADFIRQTGHVPKQSFSFWKSCF